jgi:hypothetical protein
LGKAFPSCRVVVGFLLCHVFAESRRIVDFCRIQICGSLADISEILAMNLQLTADAERAGREMHSSSMHILQSISRSIRISSVVLISGSFQATPQF